jgi:diguanylate cyclase (GGDEF)-like protein
MGYDISDERTQAQSLSPTWDRPAEDLTFLALRGPDVGTRYLVKPPGGVIGREDGAAIKIRDPNISRRAALIEFAGGRVLITDLGSRNGVWVNGVQISRAEIHDGQHVQLSNDTILRVRFQDPVETELLEDLQFAVIKDQLTGLANRRYVAERLTQELSYARRHGEALSVALLDIDDCKKVVDTDGQLVADKLLLEIANAVRKNTRVEDVIARYGADELLIILRGTDKKAADTLCNRICQSVHKKVLDIGGDVPIRPSVSIGVSTFAKAKPKKTDKPSETVTAEEAAELTLQADAALYKAKDGGKNQVAHWKD